METEGTVTISLKRYEELMTKEKAVEKNLPIIYCYSTYSKHNSISVSEPNELIKTLTETINELNKWSDYVNNENRKLTIELSNKTKKGWW